MLKRAIVLVSLIVFCFQASLSFSQHQVLPSGSFHYHIPITLPATGTPMPSLGIEYHSDAGSSYLGRGWSITGLSVIERTPSSKAINYDANDKFRGPHGLLVDKTEVGNSILRYQTQLQSFIRYEAFIEHGIESCDEEKNGMHCQWLSQDTHGNRKYYGSTKTSRVYHPSHPEAIQAWLVDRVEDQHRNGYTVEWDLGPESHAAGGYLPKKILSKKRTETEAQVEVEFIYKDASHSFAKYHHGAPVTQSRILEKILIKVNEMTIRHYRFSYEANILNQQDQLIAVREYEYSDQGIPTLVRNHAFQWTPTASLNYEEQFDYEVPNVPHDNIKTTYPLDFNGDGKTDIAILLENDQGVPAWLEVLEATGGETPIDPKSYYVPNRTAVTPFFVTDYNTDGKDDLIRQISVEIETEEETEEEPERELAFEVLNSDGKEVVNTFASTPVPPWNQVLTADIDGDQEIEFIEVYAKNNNTFLRVWEWSGSDFQQKTSGHKILDYQLTPSHSYRFLTGDTDGDGRTELLMISHARTGPGELDFDTWHFNKEIQHSTHSIRTVVPNEWNHRNQYLPADINGDGSMDLLVIFSNHKDSPIHTDRRLWPLLSTNEGFQELPKHKLELKKETIYRVKDINHDGLSDLIAFSNTPPSNDTTPEGNTFLDSITSLNDDPDAPIYFYSWISQGDTFTEQDARKMGEGDADTRYHVANAGQLNQYVAKIYKSENAGRVSIQGFRGYRDFQQQGSFIEEIQVPLGGTLHIDYTAINEIPGALAPDTTDCYHPLNESFSNIAPLNFETFEECGIPSKGYPPLVTQVTLDNQRSAEHVLPSSTRYNYKNGRFKPGFPEQRMSLGFQEIQITNEQTQTTKTHYYSFPENVPSQIPGPNLTQEHDSAGELLFEHRQWYSHGLKNQSTWTRISRTHTLKYYNGDAYPAADKTWSYDQDGLVNELRQCDQPGIKLCSLEEDAWRITRYYRDSFDHDAWKVGLLKRRWQSYEIPVSEDALTLSAERFEYSNRQLTKKEALLCDDSEKCQINQWGSILSENTRWMLIEHQHEYDLYGNLTSSQNALGQTNQFDYDTRFPHKINQVQTPEGAFKRTSYDTWGRVSKITDANQNFIAYKYLSTNRLEKKQYYHQSYRLTYQVSYDYSGLDQYHLPSVPYFKVYHRDGESTQLQAHILDGFGETYMTIDTHLDENNEEVYLVQQTEQQATPEGYLIYSRRPEYTKTFDLNDYLLPDLSEAESWFVAKINLAGRPTQKWKPSQELLPIDVPAADMPISSLNIYTTSHTDNWKRALVLEKDYHILPDSEASEKRYLEIVSRNISVLSDSEILREESSLSNLGMLLSKTDNLGSTTHYHYNQAKQLTEVNIPTETGHQSLSFEYDNWGRKRKTEDASTGTTTYDYQQGTQTYHMTGAVPSTFTASYTQSITDAKGQKTVLYYDALGRLLYKKTHRGTGNTRFFYDGTEFGTDYSPHFSNLRGKISTIQNAHETIQFIYNSKGQVTRKYIHNHELGMVFESKNKYDGFGNLSSHQFNDPYLMDAPFEVSYEHSSKGHLEQILINGTPWASFSQYNIHGKPEVREYLEGNTTAHYEYQKDNGVLRSITNVNGDGDSLQHLKYHYTPEGNIGHIVDIETEQSTYYQYDDLNRLVQTNASSYGSKEYDYDLAGNLTHIEGKSTRDLQYQNHQAVSGDQFQASYDKRGNMVKKTLDGTQWLYQYNDDQQLILVMKKETGDAAYRIFEQYSYDYRGLRIKKVQHRRDQSSLITYYINEEYEIQYDTRTQERHATLSISDSAGNNLASVQFRRSPASTCDLAGNYTLSESDAYDGLVSNWNFYHYNHINSLSVVTNAEGKQTSNIEYYPYGEVVEQISSANHRNHPRKYTGQEHDDSNLIYYRSRYYDPAIGRFITPDVLIPEPNNAQAYNRYSYVLGNPIMYHDPSGHSSTQCSALMGPYADTSNDGPTVGYTISTLLYEAPSGSCLAPLEEKPKKSKRKKTNNPIGNLFKEVEDLVKNPADKLTPLAQKAEHELAHLGNIGNRNPKLTVTAVSVAGTVATAAGCIPCGYAAAATAGALKTKYSGGSDQEAFFTAVYYMALHDVGQNIQGPLKESIGYSTLGERVAVEAIQGSIAGGAVALLEPSNQGRNPLEVVASGAITGGIVGGLGGGLAGSTWDVMSPDERLNLIGQAVVMGGLLESKAFPLPYDPFSSEDEEEQP